MPRNFACQFTRNTCVGSIISFSAASALCKARRTINHSLAPLARSARAVLSDPRGTRWLARRAEDIRRRSLKLPLPFGDLVRMDIKPLCQFGHCAFTRNRCQCHVCLERHEDHAWGSLRHLLFHLSALTRAQVPVALLIAWTTFLAPPLP